MSQWTCIYKLLLLDLGSMVAYKYIDTDKVYVIKVNEMLNL